MQKQQQQSFAAEIKIREIMARPVWNWDEMCLVFGMASSTMEVVHKEKPLPLFTVGRRRHIMRDAALGWLESQQTESPYTVRKINRSYK